MARRVVVEILGDSSQLERAFRRSARSANEFNRKVGQSTRGVVSASVAFRGLGRSVGFASGAFLGGAGFAGAVKSSVEAASDLNEQLSKTRVVFGRASQDVTDWSQTSADAFGQSRRQALATASSFGAMLAPLGILGKESADQSRALTELGSDLASFYNTDVQDALDAIRSGLVGEAEPLRRYGVLLSETRVQQEALRETGKRHASQLTDQEKVLARIALIYKDTGQAQGDFARTQGGLANQTRKLQANVDDLQATIGNALIPALVNATSAANDFANELKGLSTSSEGAHNWIRLLAKHLPDIAQNLPEIGPFARAWGDVADQLERADKAARKALQTVGKLSPEDIARRQERAVVNPPGTRGPNLRPDRVPPPPRPGVPITLRNQWFDARIARQLDRLQDIGLRKQLVGLRRIASEIRSRIAITRDATRRLNLEDQLVGIYREQRSIQEQITAQITAQNQALKDRAEAIKAAVLERLQRSQQARHDRQDLQDALEQLRIARLQGGPKGVQAATRAVQDVRDRIALAQLEAAPARLRRGQFALGATIVVNVHGTDSPEAVAKKVVEIIQRRSRHTTTQTRGPAAGAYAH